MKNTLLRNSILASFLLTFSTINLNAQSIDNRCFLLSKEHFILKEDIFVPLEGFKSSNKTLNSDVIVRFEKEPDNLLTASISLEKPFAYNSAGWFHCYNKATTYFCSQDDDGGNFKIDLKNRTFSSTHARLADSPDIPIIQAIQGTKKNIKYKEIKCELKNDNKKEKLKEQYRNSIKNKEHSIYHLDFNDKVIFAVGELNTKEVQKKKMQDEHYETLILKSLDKGKTWTRVDINIDIPLDDIVIIDNTIITTGSMEGSGGTILVSNDLGNSWREVTTGMIHSLEYNNNEIKIYLSTVPEMLISKDLGKTWIEKRVGE